jgi:hypothetical protein
VQQQRFSGVHTLEFLHPALRSDSQYTPSGSRLKLIKLIE